MCESKTLKTAWLIVGILLVGGIASAQVDARFSAQISGTLNIHWELISGPAGAPIGCTGIEFTDGTLADAADGTVTMSGTGVSIGGCIGLDNYTFTMAPDGLSLDGFASTVPMALARGPHDPAFVGDWVSGGYVYRAHIAADPFPVPDYNPEIAGEWIGWWDRLPDVEMGSVSLTIHDPFWDGNQWSFEGLFEWKGLFGTECSGSEIVQGVMDATGAVALAGMDVVDPVNWTPDNYSGQRSADGLTLSGTSSAGTWTVTRVAPFHVPGEVASIQGAVDMFSAKPGLRIEVGAGTHAENLDLGALAANPGAVDIVGLGADATTVIDDGMATAGDPIIATNGAAAAYPVRLRNVTISGGFVETASWADSGAGLRVNGGSRNFVTEACVLRGNHLEKVTGDWSTGGGGAYLHPGSRARFDACVFQDNTTAPYVSSNWSTGGGLGAREATVYLVDTVFQGNAAYVGSGANCDASIVRATRCRFVANNPNGDGKIGGGMSTRAWTDAVLSECEFLGNQVVLDGPGTGAGGGWSSVQCVVEMIDTVFESNQAAYGAGATFANGSATLRGCRFGGPDGAGNVSVHPGYPSQYSNGGAINFRDGVFDIHDTLFEGNSANNGGAIVAYLNSGGLVMEGTTFRGNQADEGGGLFLSGNGGSARAMDTDFVDNTATNIGGGVMVHQLGITFINTRFFRNTSFGNAAGALAVYWGLANAQVHNCSFVENSAQGGQATAAAVGVWYGMLGLHNSILWGNTSTLGTLEKQQIDFAPESDISVRNAIIEGLDPGTTLLGPGPFSGEDPQFVDQAAGDLHLMPYSPARDAGDASLLPSYVETDYEGNTRIIGVEVDLGIYEHEATVGTGRDETAAIPRIGLSSAYPNPFNPQVTISYMLDREMPAKVSIYDARGSLVRVLADGMSSAGELSVVWDGTDQGGRRQASGTYIVELRAGKVRDSRSLSLLK